MENTNFLKEKYGLHTSSEVESAARRTEARTSERVPQDPASRIQNYLDRLERLALDPNREQPRKKMGGGYDDTDYPRSLLLLREMVMNKYVRPNKDKMAQGAAVVEERAARELGIEAHYGEEQLEQRGEIAVRDMESSLDQWIRYLSDPNEPYFTWFRYYAFRSILGLGEYDKDRGEFPNRSAGTIRLFPDIDRGALAYIQDIIQAAKDPVALGLLRKAQLETATPSDLLLTKERAQEFAKLSFAKQYAEGIKQAGEITPELRAETRGKWVTYPKDSDPIPLWASLQNKSTAWCTKGFASAEIQLKGGDFWVYYTLDKQGNPTIPRIAIRMQNDGIFEVRGVADAEQNLEGNMCNIAEEKINQLPRAKKYRRALADMKRVTRLVRKQEMGELFTRDDLFFLHEINGFIEGFGYRKDPRIAELLSQRNPEEDMLIFFECTKGQIAYTMGEIHEGTKAYLGKIVPGFFETLEKYHIKQVYTSFPDSRIVRKTVAVGGKTSRELQEKFIKEDRFYVVYGAQKMMAGNDFTTQTYVKDVDLIRLKAKDLGFTIKPTLDEIYERAKQFGLDLCSAEDGVHYRLAYTDQPDDTCCWIAMKPITGGEGPSIFILRGFDTGLCLSGFPLAELSNFRLQDEFVFRIGPALRKKGFGRGRWPQ